MPARSHPLSLPVKENDVEISIAGKKLRLTNLQKPFWPELGIAKREWMRPLEAALASKKLTKKGEKRATTYFAA